MPWQADRRSFHLQHRPSPFCPTTSPPPPAPSAGSIRQPGVARQERTVARRFSEDRHRHERRHDDAQARHPSQGLLATRPIQPGLLPSDQRTYVAGTGRTSLSGAGVLQTGVVDENDAFNPAAAVKRRLRPTLQPGVLLLRRKKQLCRGFGPASPPTAARAPFSLQPGIPSAQRRREWRHDASS